MFKQLSFTSTLILVAAFSAAAAAIAAPPQTSVVSIGFDHNAVVVSGITPGGRAVLFGVARERTARKPSSLRFVRRAEILVDAAKTGTVTFDLGESVPAVAIWAAIDLTSGGYAARPSPGYDATPLAVTDSVKNDSAGQLKKLDWPAAEMEALLVRPGGGAWRATVAKYSKRDEHGAPNKPIRADVETMAAVGDSAAAPKTFKQGDVIVLIDPRWMQYAVVEVGR